MKTVSNDCGHNQWPLLHASSQPEPDTRVSLMLPYGAYTRAPQSWQTNLPLGSHLHWAWSNKDIFCKKEMGLTVSNPAYVLGQNYAASPRRCRVTWEIDSLKNSPLWLGLAHLGSKTFWVEPNYTVFVQDLTHWAPSWWHGLVYAIAFQNTKKLFGYNIIILWMPESANGVF